MNKIFKKLNIFAIIISFIIIFFLFPLNGHAEDTGYVEYNYALYHEYTGEEILLDDLVLTFNGTTLVKDTDYTITYLSTNLSEVGTKMLKITLDEDSDYVTQETTKEDTITYYVVDKIIDLSDYGISEGMTVEKENGEASLNSLAAPISEVYSDFLTIGDSTTTSNEGALYFNFSNQYHTVIRYKDAYQNTYYKYSQEGDPVLNINFFAVDALITENDERIEIDNLNNLAYKLVSNSSVDVSWNGDILFENSLLTAETDYDTYLYIPELYGNETAVTSIDSTYTDGSVYNVILQIVFKGNYGGSITKTLKLCPSIEDADIEALEGGNVTHEQSGYIISLVYGSDTIPICLKMTIDGQEKTLVYGTDFTYDSSVLWGQVGMGGISLDIQGIGNYAGQRENVWVYLSAKSITSDTITYEANSNAYYDGTNDPVLGIIIYDNDIPGDNKVISDDYYEITIISLDSENRIGTARVEGTIAYTDYFDVEFELATRRWGDDGLECTVNWDLEKDGSYYMYYKEGEIKPSFTLTDIVNSETYELVEGTDFNSEVQQSNDTYNLYIKFIGNYSGEVFYTFKTINEITIDDPLLEVTGLNDADYYIGANSTMSPNPIVSYNGIELSSDEYDIIRSIKDDDENEYETRITSAAADGRVFHGTITINFTGTYAGSVSYTYEIKPSIETFALVSLDDGRMDGNHLYYSYTGSKIKPSFELQYEINDNTVKLTYGTDFTLSSTDTDSLEIGPDAIENKEYLLKGINNYGGTYYIYFDIEAKSIESSDISVSISNNCYVSTNLESSDAQTYECGFNLYDETRDYNLVPNEDFEVGYEAVDDMVIVYFSGINNYSGNLEKQVYKATAKLKTDIVDITYDTAYNDYNAMYYTGSETHPEVKVAIGETELVLDTDYSVSYEAKSEYSYGSMVVLHIVGLNSFYGKLDYEYIIYSPLFEDYEFAYVKNKNISDILSILEINDRFESITDDEIPAVGNYSVTGTLKPGFVFENGDEYSLTGSFNLNITSSEINDNFNITIEELRYKNEELIPAVTIVDSFGTELEKDIDYELTYENNKDVGKGSVLIKGLGNYIGELNKEFDILGKDITKEDIIVTKEENCYIDENNNYTFEYKIYDQTFDYYLVKDTDYEISFEDSGTEVIFYITGIRNYDGRIELNAIKASNLITDDNIIVTYDKKDENNNIMYFINDIVHPNISISNGDYELVLDTDYSLSYEGDYSYGSTIKITIIGLNDYYFKFNDSYIIKSYEIEDILLEFSGKTTLKKLIDESKYKDMFESYDDLEINEANDYESNFKVNKGYVIKKNDNYLLEGNILIHVIADDTELNEIIENAATDIISSATQSVDFNLDSIDFENLTGLSKDELLMAKDYYNNLEQYIVDNKIDELVNNHLKDLGYNVTVEVSEIAVKLKDYLDTYAVNVGYTNFNSQVDDAINGVIVEEEKEILKEELLSYIHRHVTPGVLAPIHNSQGNVNENNKVDNENLNNLINDQISTVKYEQCLDDDLRDEKYATTIEKIHEIRNVSINIIKHTQKQTIANNNIEAYYNELVESGKYNEAQLLLLKEVFDEMQSEVLELLNDGNKDFQEELDKIVIKAIEKLSGVPISNLSIETLDGINANISSSSGMASNTELEISYAAKNVSLAIGKAINNNNVTGVDNGLLLIKNKDVKEAFDIDLVVEGEKVNEFDGTYTIRILLTDELKAFNNLQIIYLTSDGKVEVHDTQVLGDYLVFTTTHFSTYYLLGDKIFDFAPIIKILLAVIVALVIFIVYLILRIKKKKISQIGMTASLFLIPFSSILSINVLVVCVILGIIAFILLVTAILLAIKDYKIDRRIEDEE